MYGASAIIKQTDHVLIVNSNDFEDLTAFVHFMAEHLLSQRLTIVEHLPGC